MANPIKRFNISSLDLDDIPTPRISSYHAAIASLREANIRLPKNIDARLTNMLVKSASYHILLSWITPLIGDGWQILVTTQSRGYCHAARRIITIPIHATSKPADYLTWYLAHEIAHAYDQCMHNHGKEFMEWLIKICPNDCIHHELGYKPRNAKQAGITENWSNLLEL